MRAANRNALQGEVSRTGFTCIENAGSLLESAIPGGGSSKQIQNKGVPEFISRNVCERKRNPFREREKKNCMRARSADAEQTGIRSRNIKTPKISIPTYSHGGVSPRRHKKLCAYFEYERRRKEYNHFRFELDPACYGFFSALQYPEGRKSSAARWRNGSAVPALTKCRN